MLLADRISSYGCTWKVWRALKRSYSCSRRTLTPLSCTPNVPRASITRYTHAKHEPILNYDLLWPEIKLLIARLNWIYANILRKTRLLTAWVREISLMTSPLVKSYFPKLYWALEARWCSGVASGFRSEGRSFRGYVRFLFPWTRNSASHRYLSPRCVNGYRRHTTAGNRLRWTSITFRVK